MIARAALDESERALEWIRAVEDEEVEGIAPDLIWLEIGNAFSGYVRAGTVSREDGSHDVAAALRVPLRTAAIGELALASFAVALDRGLSVYDACYAALAEAEGALLVTADRQLAGAAVRAELIA